MDIWEINAAGMTTDLARMNAIANNIANSATPSFKREMAIARPFAIYVTATGDAGGLLAGGFPELAAATDHRQGVLRFTGNPLDIALDDSNSYFELAGPAGALYTRRGDFRVNSNGLLASEAGTPVMGISGEIAIGSTTPVIDASGRVFDGERLVGQLRIVQIANPAALEQRGLGLFGRGEANSTRPERFDRVRQGYLEASNVNLMAEMVRLTETMRHFEFSQRVLQGYDAVLERAIRSLGEF